MEPLVNACLSNALAAMLLAVLAVVVAALRQRPALVHSLWLLVLLKLVTPPVVPFAIAPPASMPTEPTIDVADKRALTIDSPIDASAEGAIAQTIQPAAVFEGAPTSDMVETGIVSGWIKAAALAVWVCGAIGWWGVALRRVTRFGYWLREAELAPAQVQEQARQAAERLGLAYCPQVWIVPGLVPPLLWSIGGPTRLVVPAMLWAELDLEARYTLLVHELAHLRRRDHWVRWIELVVTGLYWWHPVVWWARRSLREAEEQCCDAWVVWALPGSSRTYAHALVATLDFLSSARTAAPLGASAIGHVSCLKRRLRMIVRTSTPRALSWPGRVAVLALAIGFLPLALTRAQQPAPESELASSPAVAAGTGVSVADFDGDGRADVAIAEGTGVASTPEAAAHDDVQLLRSQIQKLEKELQVYRDRLSKLETNTHEVRSSSGPRRIQNRTGQLIGQGIKSVHAPGAGPQGLTIPAPATVPAVPALPALPGVAAAPSTVAAPVAPVPPVPPVPPVAATLAGPRAANTPAPASGTTIGVAPSARTAIEPTVSASAPRRASLDQEKRLRALEQKLDQLLIELKDLRRGSTDESGTQARP